MTESEADPKLHVSFNPDSSRPMVQLYGNPQGLRLLAGELLKIADLVQGKGIGSDPVEHFHFKSKTKDWILPNSVELTIGRMDHRDTGCTDWYENNTESMRAYLQQRLEQLDELEN